MTDAKLRIDALVKRALGSRHLNVKQWGGFLQVADRFSASSPAKPRNWRETVPSCCYGCLYSSKN